MLLIERKFLLVWGVISVSALFTLIGVPLLGAIETPAYFDEVNFHLPTIELFAERWPSVDLTVTFTATTPLYHYLIASLAQITNDHLVLHQVSASVLWVLYGAYSVWLLREGKSWRAIVYGLPFFLSYYILHRALVFAPDNLAWLLSLCVFYVAFSNQRYSKLMLFGGFFLTALVATRQIFLWAWAPLIVAAWLGQSNQQYQTTTAHNSLFLKRFFDQTSWFRVAGMVVAGLPAIAVLLFFYVIWGGLTPSYVANISQGTNLAVPAVVLSLIGVYSLFYAGFLLPTFVSLFRTGRVSLAAVALLGLVLALFPETTYVWEEGRATGIWQLVAKVPYFWGRTSPVLLILASFGAIVSFLWFRALDPRWGWIFVSLLVAFCVTQSATLNAWQRYYDPFILMLLGLFSARIAAARDSKNWQRLCLVGPLVGGGLQFVLSLYKLTWF